ncbi:hypothetical protein SDC9_170021 [bioreactor metagenome]|uniref:Uncharacterized protein n=1 Tax=bioreactor metagenome TaxID=1076179 RepID=A0A645G6X6_9ZZZZ
MPAGSPGCKEELFICILYLICEYVGVAIIEIPEHFLANTALEELTLI